MKQKQEIRKKYSENKKHFGKAQNENTIKDLKSEVEIFSQKGEQRDGKLKGKISEETREPDQAGQYSNNRHSRKKEQRDIILEEVVTKIIQENFLTGRGHHTSTKMDKANT